MTRIDDNGRDDAMLDSFFAAGRDEAPVPSADLLARIMADAESEATAREAVTPRPKANRSLIAALAAMVGGWPAFAGMASAAVAGIWIGAAQPTALATLTGDVFTAGSTTSAATSDYELEEIVPGYAALMTYGEALEQ